MVEEKKDEDSEISSSNLTKITDSEGMVIIPEELPILTLRNTVLFPGSIVPLGVGRSKTVQLVEESIRNEALVAIVAQRDPKVEDPSPSDLYTMGCAARLVKLVKASKDNFSVVVQGLSRVRISEYTQSVPFLKARIQPVLDATSSTVEVGALTMSLKKTAREVLRLIPELPPSAAELLERVEDAGVLADLIASNVEANLDEKQSVLETVELVSRMRRVLELLSRQLEVLKLSHKINSQVKGEMNKTQRDYYLRQQLKAIKDELGESEEGSDDDLAELEARVNDAKLPGDADKAARKELRRLRNMNPSQAEYTVSRTYLEWLCDLPWNKVSEDAIALQEVREVLNADHYGLEKIKKRIIEFLAVRKLKTDMKGPILCFVGPPGTGKTSLGQSIAKAINRKFVRVALGGVRDEAEVRGHRRTYVGALPGRIIQGIKKAGTVNPVFLLDEVDKLAHDLRGDPSSALLEALDPEQNNAFVDHYIDVPFDLSKCFFIATANVTDTIPPALMDRLEMLELHGYTDEEKLEIALKHLIPRALEEHGLDNKQCEISQDSIKSLVRNYTREAGVRNLKREIAGICRSVAVQYAEGNGVQARQIVPDDLRTILGPSKFFDEMAERTDKSGVATGLAWTSAGGDILFIEATKMKGKGALTLTGQLGDVMKESAQAAMSYVRSMAKSFGIDEDSFEKFDIHIHVPAGAIPKDGPSAGVTMLTALVSLLTGILVRANVAMTGEISLQGKVLPVGGIKEKVLAALRSGVSCVIIPNRNEKDLVEIPAKVLQEINVVFASDVEQVLAAALVHLPGNLARKDHAASDVVQIQN